MKNLDNLRNNIRRKCESFIEEKGIDYIKYDDKFELQQIFVGNRQFRSGELVKIIGIQEEVDKMKAVVGFYFDTYHLVATDYNFARSNVKDRSNK